MLTDVGDNIVYSWKYIPTDKCLEVPNTAYKRTGANDEYRPNTGGTNARRANPIPRRERGGG